MSAFDMSALVTAFANAYALPFARESAPIYTGGVATPGGWTMLTLDECFITPLSEREIDLLPEGARERGGVKVIMRSGLELGYRTPARGDVFAWQGRIYRVTGLADWSTAANFQSATAVQEDTDHTTLVAFVTAEGGEVEEP